MKRVVCILVFLVALGTATAGLWTWRGRTTTSVTLWDRPEFAPVGTNEEARNRGVSFEIWLGATGTRYKGTVYTAQEALEAAVVSVVREKKLTPDEISRAPVCMMVDAARVPYGRLATVLSMCARLGFKTIAVLGDRDVRPGYSAPAEVPVALPVVTHGTPIRLDAARPKNWIVVDVHRNGQAYVNGVGPLAMPPGVSPSPFARRIVEEASSCSCAEERPLLIRADEQVPTAFLRRVILAGCGNHLWDFYFVGKLTDGRTCLVARVDEPCPNGFWWGDEEEEEEPVAPPPPDIHTAQVGESVWSYVLEDDGSARIWGGRDPDDWAGYLCAVHPKPVGALTIPAQLDGHPVSAVGDSALASCDLTSVQFPSGLREIGRYAFSNCRNLTAVTLPESLCCLGDGAFFGTGLMRLKIPAGVSYVDHWTWSLLDRLEAFEVDADNPKYSAVAGILYNKDRSKVLRVPQARTFVALEPTVREIGAYAFEYCSITNIVLPPGLCRFGEYAFSRCDRLESVSIPEGVEELERTVFMCCGALKTVKLPASLEQIGSGAFHGCTNLTEITLPQDCRHVGYDAFAECSNLRHISLPQGRLYLENHAFRDVHPDCVFSQGPLLRYRPDRTCTVLSPLGWALLAGGLLVLGAVLVATWKCFAIIRGQSNNNC